MSSQKFKFVSPGIFLKEIDQSQIPKAAAPIGPTIIGRSRRGPALRPIQVNSYFTIHKNLISQQAYYFQLLIQFDFSYANLNF